jgi:hypothetical protein
MKPVFKHGLKGFQGTNRSEDLVYCSYNQGELIIAKKRPHRKADTNNRNFASIGKNLGNLFRTFTAEYKSDLHTYTLLLHSVAHNPHKIDVSPYMVYTKMMWTLKRLNPDIDLSTITREDILKNGYPVRSVNEAMRSGLLWNIPEAAMLEHKI